MPRDPATGPVRVFLDAADTPEVDLGAWVLRGMARGTLLSLGRGIVADLEALGAPYACVPGDCSPGARARRHRSSCADLEVTPSDEERARIEAVRSAPELADLGDGPAFDEGGSISRPHRRCFFARPAPDGSTAGLRCALHSLEDARGWARGRVKPLPCRLFPLALVAFDADRVLLTALHRHTSRALSGRPAAAFPCLHRAGAPPLAVSERETIEAILGKRAWKKLYDAIVAP